MVDSGGSTGRLRDELGILPPGDILKCLLALSPEREYVRKFFQTRFKTSKRLKGHNAGNMLLTILSQYAGSFPEGILALGEILNVRGNVLPVTTSKATLVAELTDGNFLFGESAIDVPRGNQREKIKKTFLVPHHKNKVSVYPPIIKKIKESDFIFVGPGDLYTSIIPNFLVAGVKEAVQKTRAKIIYISNIMTKFGETDNFKLADFVKELEKSIGTNINFVLANSDEPNSKILNNYRKQKSSFVKINKKIKNKKIIAKDLLDVSGGIIRHNPEKLAKAIEEIIK